ncbi:serine/threonine-protein kinase [Nocardia sp. SYP-A9097]|uniref:serine/threonine-protein kinase n=1 Tax=Nocardia sp. SYP-A9097 TaxID=2663237 RepID=UPI001891239C|nr:serine/threonine-protein kinase [Nocardia sp. SYP-A9097]
MTIKPLAPDETRMIGGYRVLGVLGAGGMGRVLLGAGPDGRLVAIKQVHPHLLDQRGYRARFTREVAASTRVSGAFTAPVVDFDVDADIPWLASLFVNGVPLDQAVREHGPLPAPAVLALAAGMAVALQNIHAAGLIHRDLKPANVLLTSDGPRVIDFGIAYLVENPTGITETGATLGSPAYMSPEQTLGEPLSAASDVFSLGTLLAMAATGTNPFAAASLAYTLFRIAHTEPDLELVPLELRELIAACLQRDPHFRPTTAQLLEGLGRLPGGPAPWPAPIQEAIARQHRELAGIAADPDATVVSSRIGRAGDATRPLRSAGAKRSRRRPLRLALIAALAVVALAAAGLTWVRLGHPQAPPPVAVPLLSQLRNTDTCAWLRQAVDGAVPANSGWPADTGAWTMEMTWDWGCSAQSGDHRLTVQPGSPLTAMKPTGGTVAGLRTLGIAGFGHCARGVDLSRTAGPWGIDVGTGPSDDCGFTEFVLSQLIRTQSSAPRRTDAASLAGVDVCALVTHDLLNALIGPVQEQPSQVDAHSCQWPGSSTVRVRSDLAQLPNYAADESFDLGGGLHALTRSAATRSTSECELTYAYRTVGDQQEALWVTTRGSDGEYEKLCTTSASVLRAAIGQLPKAN